MTQGITISRRRVPQTNIVTGWNGIGIVTKAVDDSAGLCQHQLAIACSAIPASGVLRVRARPMKSAFYLLVEDILLTNSGGAFLIFPGLIDGISLQFTTGLTSGLTVTADLTSCAEDFGSATLRIMT